MNTTKQINIKNRTLVILKILMQSYQKLIKNHIMTLASIILDMSPRKKLVIV